MKKRILFVDDNPKVLEVYRRHFESDAAAWSVSFSIGGAGALNLMDSVPCDVIVAKWRMTGMTGLELFREVVKIRPETERIVVSDAADQQEVAERLADRHQFLAKPLDLDALRSAIWCVCSMQNSARDAKIEELLARDCRVPSLPSIYFKILKVMDSPDASVSEIGELIAQDPAMTARILQVVNSAMFGIARRISNVAGAMQVLGLHRVRALALASQTFSCFDPVRMKGFPLSRVWNHSIAAGDIAQRICRAEGVSRVVAEEAQLACMLHDVGKVILASGDPERYQSAVALATKRRVPVNEIECEIFGVSHAEVGAHLFSKWGLPIAVIEAIGLHHAPGLSTLRGFTPLTAVHVANCIENEMTGSAFDTTLPEIDETYLDGIGLADRLSAWREAVDEVEICETASTG